MLNLSQIESDLITALKAKNSVAVSTLRGLKTRIQNEKISKQKELSEEEIVSLIKSEIKRRKEAAGAFESGNRPEQAAAELSEALVLEKYLPRQMSEQEITAAVEKIISEESATAADFGKLMGKLKAQIGQTADGSVIAKLLKEKLK